ncbi:MAG TPA: HAEPLYID family protein, partial [Lunatimonas sp.]|nr:HAEPLYID family protein [Lunatimonas sp.]
MRLQIFKKVLFILLIGFFPFLGIAQTENDTTIRLDNIYLDSVFIGEIENRPGLKAKVLHAEPLYIDLIRDLGARKGEKEWNYGFGMKTDQNFDEYEALVEYEWAPIDRLGLEIELPLTFYGPSSADPTEKRQSSRLESIKVAAQWSFFVSEKLNTSMALGYIHEFELVDLNMMRSDDLFKGNSYNPFFVLAKRWGLNYHTLIYTGPRLIKEFDSPNWEHVYEINTNFHYMI